MSSNAFAALTRQAGAVSRRGSLRAFGGVVRATQLAAPANARAGKNRKAKKQCKKQKARCIAAVTGYCSTLPDPPFCENIYLARCEEESTLQESLYFRNELQLMLAQAGWTDITIYRGYSGEVATADDTMLVFVARMDV